MSDLSSDPEHELEQARLLDRFVVEELHSDFSGSGSDRDMSLESSDVAMYSGQQESDVEDVGSDNSDRVATGNDGSSDDASVSSEGFDPYDGASEPSSSGPTQYSIKREANYFNWKQARSSLATAAMAGQGPQHPPPMCFGTCGNEAILRCLTCEMAGVYMCAGCDQTIHNVAHCHVRQHWLHGFYQNLAPHRFLVPLQGPILPEGPPSAQDQLPPASLGYAIQDVCLLVDERAPSTPCTCSEGAEWGEALQGKQITCITPLGRVDGFCLAQFKCRTCGGVQCQDRHDMQRAGLWPCTPSASRVQTFISEDLLRDWRHTQSTAFGTSLTSFVSKLDLRSKLMGVEGVIREEHVTDAYREWRCNEWEMEMAGLMSSTQCPACSEGQHAIHSDGNLKMYTYDRDREMFREAYYDEIFIRDRITTQHLQALDLALSSQSAQDDDRHCGRGYWKATRDRPNKYKDLFYSGRVVGGCRHLIIQRAVNIIHSGERYGYHHLLHCDFTFPKGVKHVFQDIMCKYWPWSQRANAVLRVPTAEPNPAAARVPDEAVESAVVPLVSGAHGKLHSWHCQVLHSPSWRKGAGLGAGEDMELCFSTLSRLSNSTKNMGAARRTDTISEVSYDLNMGRILRQTAELSRRYAATIKKAIGAAAAYSELCNEVLSRPSVEVADAEIETLLLEVISVAKEHEAREPTELGLRTEYFKCCKQYEEAMLLEVMLRGSSSVDTVLAGQDFAELRRQAATLTSNLPKYARRCADLERQLVDRNTLPPEIAASASAARVQESTAGVVRTYGRTMRALVDQLEAVVLDGMLDQGGTAAVQRALAAGKTAATSLADVEQHMTSQDSASVLAACREELAEHTCVQLQEQMEAMQLQIEKCRSAVTNEAATSKERTRYRSKGADLKAQVGKVVEQYNLCIWHGRTRRQPAELEAVLAGDFPWMASVDGNMRGISFKSKLRLCEAWNLLQRCREERGLLEKEMRACHTFWTCKEAATSLQITALLDDDWEPLEQSVSPEAGTYKISSHAIASNAAVRRGVIARLRQTNAVAVSQMEKCRIAFSSALGDMAAVAAPSQLLTAEQDPESSLSAGELADQPDGHRALGQSSTPLRALQPPASAALEDSVSEPEPSPASHEPSHEPSLADDAAAPSEERMTSSMQSNPVVMVRSVPDDATVAAQGFTWENNSCGPDFLSMCLAACWHELGSGMSEQPPLGALLASMQRQFGADMADSGLQHRVLDLVYAKYANYAASSAWRPGSFTGMYALVEAFGAQLNDVNIIHGTVIGECEACGAQQESLRSFPYISLVRIPRSDAVTRGTDGQLMIEMPDIIDLCCNLPNLNCRPCQRGGRAGTVQRQFTVHGANGLLCVVLPKTAENKLEDVDGRQIKLDVQSALEVRVGCLELELRVLHICNDGHHYGYFQHTTSHTCQIPSGWYFYDDMRNGGKALYIGTQLKFWHDPASIECLMYIERRAHASA